MAILLPYLKVPPPEKHIMGWQLRIGKVEQAKEYNKAMNFKSLTCCF